MSRKIIALIKVKVNGGTAGVRKRLHTTNRANSPLRTDFLNRSAGVGSCVWNHIDMSPLSPQASANSDKVFLSVTNPQNPHNEPQTRQDQQSDKLLPMLRRKNTVVIHEQPTVPATAATSLQASPVNNPSAGSSSATKLYKKKISDVSQHQQHELEMLQLSGSELEKTPRAETAKKSTATSTVDAKKSANTPTGETAKKSANLPKIPNVPDSSPESSTKTSQQPRKTVEKIKKNLNNN